MRAPFQSLLPLNLLQTGVNLRQLHSYRLLKNGQAHGPSSPRFSLPLVLTFLLTILVVVSGIWFKTHPTFFYDLRVASRISIDAEITLYATVKPFDGSISTPDSPLPVPQLETSLLADAKIGSTLVAAASLEAYPRVIEPGDQAPKANEILFAIATTADRAIERMSHGLWPAFMMNPQSPCFVVLAPEEAHRVKSVRQVSDSLGLHCVVKASRLKRYPWRVLNLPREAEQPFQDASPSVKWIVIGDE